MSGNDIFSDGKRLRETTSAVSRKPPWWREQHCTHLIMVDCSSRDWLVHPPHFRCSSWPSGVRV
eukprot:UN13926